MLLVLEKELPPVKHPGQIRFHVSSGDGGASNYTANTV